jgi:hypothetical protein
VITALSSCVFLDICETHVSFFSATLIQNSFHSDNHLACYKQATLKMTMQKHIGHHPKCPLLLFNLNKIWKYQESFCADRQMDTGKK